MIIYIYFILDILLSIETVAIFLQGFYFGRKNNSGIFMATMCILALFMIILLDGAKTFTLRILSAGIYDLIIAIAYSIFWLVLGYLFSGVHLIGKDDRGVIVKLR